jgi:hypothetical protein
MIASWRKRQRGKSDVIKRYTHNMEQKGGKLKLRYNLVTKERVDILITLCLGKEEMTYLLKETRSNKSKIEWGKKDFE